MIMEIEKVGFLDKFEPNATQVFIKIIKIVKLNIFQIRVATIKQNIKVRKQMATL